MQYRLNKSVSLWIGSVFKFFREMYAMVTRLNMIIILKCTEI